MPFIQNNRTDATDQTKKPLHTSGFQTAPLKMAEMAAPAAALVSNEEVQHVQGKYSFFWSDTAPILKSSSGWIVTGVLATLISLLTKAYLGESVTLRFALGEALHYLAFFIFVTHTLSFKGQTRESWLISWLFRSTMLFASFSVSDAARHHFLPWQLHWLSGFVIATGSILWQFRKRKRADKQRSVETT